MTNTLKGRNSFDANISNSVVAFVNKNASPYPTEVGGPSFELVPVTKQKDIMLNVARLYAKQEYDRIVELVAVLQKQADSIKRRLEITDKVYSAAYEFQVYHDQCYWLVWDTSKNILRLVRTGPNEWSTGPPINYNYEARVRWLGDHSWIEVNEEGIPIE